MSEIIIVNATALDGSGALTVLKQFISAIPEDDYNYIIFIGKLVHIDNYQLNITIINKDVKSLFKRFFWDIFGIKNWLKNHKIIPVATVSLQNTNFRTGYSIPNFIYYHNSIPFHKNIWNPLHSNERGLWFYKNIYPYFVKVHLNKKTEIFVQLRYVKDSFSRYFHFPESRIHIITPSFEIKDTSPDIELFDIQQLNLFYPAIPFIYKNHEVILRALNFLDKDIKKRVTLHLTCEESQISENLRSDININFLGNISFDRMLQIYKNADALLFPSYIETYGLPLIEAAFFGMKIIVSDLPYSREVLNSYEGASFVSYSNPESWKLEILKLFQIKGKRYKSHNFIASNSWDELFRIIKKKIQENV